MKLTFMQMRQILRNLALMFFVACGFGLTSYAQNINFKLKNVTVQTAVMELQRKYGYSVAVKSNELDMSKIISVDVQGKGVQERYKAGNRVCGYRYGKRDRADADKPCG